MTKEKITYLFKYILICNLITVTISCNKGYDSPELEGRIKSKFNYDWLFYKGDAAGAYKLEFNDASWDVVDLPHDWSIKEQMDTMWASCSGYLPGGIGWYRKRFFIGKEELNRKVFIRFDGVYNNSTVWINGEQVGYRPNGYVAFQYDITDHVKYGAENVLAVKVDHSQDADSRWYTGSGIYRDVELISTHPLHIVPWGVYVTTPEVSRGKAIVKAEVEVVNELSADATFNVENYLIFDLDTVFKTSSTVNLRSGSQDKLIENLKVEAPHLWDVDNPHLYRLITRLTSEGVVMDEKETRVGIRDISFSEKTGFSINDSTVKLKGICIHHDAGGLGVAVPPMVLKNRIETLKEMGCNAVRLAHNPHSSVFMNLCDELGMLVIVEAFDEWELPKRKWINGRNAGYPGHEGYAAYFKKWHRQDIESIVRRDRNHPSVIMWSIGNEIDYPNDPYSHPLLESEEKPGRYHWAGYQSALPDASRLGQVARNLSMYVKMLDNTRPVTAGITMPHLATAVGYIDALDVVGYNYLEGIIEREKDNYPYRIMYSSESDRSLETWTFAESNDYFLGQFLWVGFDFLGEAKEFPFRSFSNAICDLAGNKLPEYYFWKSLWQASPVLRLSTLEQKTDGNRELSELKSSWPVWNYTEKQDVVVTAFTNCEAVELFLNEKSLGINKMQDFPSKIIIWELPYKAGKLRAVGYLNGKPVAFSELETHNVASALKANADELALRANKEDVSQISVWITDHKGNIIPEGNHKIECKVQGPARLLALEDGNPLNTESYSLPYRSSHKGKIKAYIQSLDKEGDITVSFKAAGLIGDSIQINVVAK